MRHPLGGRQKIKKVIEEERKMSDQEHELIVKKLFEEINGRNVGILERLLTSNFVWHGNNDQGRDEYKKDVNAVIAAFPDAKWNIDEIRSEEDKVVVRWSFSGTQRKAWGEVPSSGRQVTYGGITIFRLEEGKIAEVWNNENLLSLYRQIGVQITLPKKKKWWRM
jgi:steroid delta-isomerase-like uncharacterized protein